MELRVSFAVVYLLSEVFAPLIVPLVIVAARKRANGPLIACASSAIVCIVALWLLSGPQSSLLNFSGPQDGPLALHFALYALAGATGQAAWVLAVYQAALGRHGRWIAALTVAQVIAYAALLFSANPCVWAEATGSFGVNGCTPLTPMTMHLISAAWLASPAAALAYALRGPLPRHGTRLGIPADGGGEGSADGELEVRAERL